MTTPPAADAVVALQPVKPAPAKVTVGEAGIVKALLKVTVTLSPAASAPVPEAVNCAVQVAVAPAFVRLPVKDTAVGDVAAEMTTLDAGLASVPSLLVCTRNNVLA